MTAVGRPTHFDVDRYLDAVEDMINADEVERAFLMLDNFPAYYREYPPERAKAIRTHLHRQLFTPVQYKGIYGDELTPEAYLEIMKLLRADLVAKEVRSFNESGITPNIMELAPGAFWLPHGLKALGLKFTYEHLSLDHAICAFEKPSKPEANIFVAFELIEHLPNEWEIYQNYLKFKRDANVVMISTPLYTYGGGMDNWEERPLGHLRTYTPSELFQKVNAMFTGFTWEMLADDTIVAIGRNS